MKWLKKWAYILLFLGTGLVYFACVDHWQVYAESVNRLKSWYEGFTGSNSKEEELLLTGGKVQVSAGDSGREDSGQGGSAQNGGAGEEKTAEGSGGGFESMAGEGESTPGQEDGQISENPEEGGEDKGPGSGREGDPEGGSPSDTAGTEDRPLQETEPGSQEEGTGEPKIPEYITVEDDYFSDAVFIGDSRTVGMFEYGGLEEITTFYASKGLTVYKLFDSQIVPSAEGKISVEEGLKQNSFSKIYLMIGINEMGTGTVETFLEKYKEVVERLKELQPEAIVYVQAIIKVTAERSAKGDYINNEGIEARNEGIALLADNEKVFYLDVNPLICDESGGMIPSYTFDGVHLKAKYIEIWKDYLKTHAISP